MGAIMKQLTRAIRGQACGQVSYAVPCSQPKAMNSARTLLIPIHRARRALAGYDLCHMIRLEELVVRLQELYVNK